MVMQPILQPIFPVPFSWEECSQAYATWGCNCGPSALSAVTGVPLDRLRGMLGDFEQKGFMNPALMFEALRKTGLDHTPFFSAQFRPKDWSHEAHSRMRYWPTWGLVRVQWEGPWTDPGVPIPARYRHTHWVGSCGDCELHRYVFDVNAMRFGGWIPYKEWSEQLVPWLLRQCEPKANGRWHVTHAIQVLRSGS